MTETDRVRPGVRGDDELVPVTVKLPAKLLGAIDVAHRNRSAFLRQAAIDALEREGLSAWASTWRGPR